MILNIYGPNTGEPRFIRQVLIDLQRDLDSHIIIVGDFNMPLSILDRSIRQKINKDIQYLNSDPERANLIDIYRTLHPKYTEYTFFSAPHHTYSKIHHIIENKSLLRLGAVAHSCNPSTLEGRGRWITRSRDRDHPGQHGETPSLLKIQKISWAWLRVPVIPATWESEAGELPEPRRRRLRWAEIAPLHSRLGNKSETPSQKKKKNTFTTIHNGLINRV